MKKIINILLVTILIVNNIFFDVINAEVVAWPDFNIKISSAWDDTYATSLSNISANSDVKFQILTIADNNVSDDFEYSMSFPSWFEYVSNSIWIWNDCPNTLIKNSINSNFRFSFSWSALPCTSEIYFTYKPTLWWNYTINILDINTSQVIKSVTLSVNWNNSISRAQTLDTNSDWYLDWYKLTFADTIAWTFNNTWLRVWTITPTLSWSVSTNIAYIKFTDWVYNSWDLPQITDAVWWVFTSVWIIGNSDINEEDSASPQLLRLNNTLISSFPSWQWISIWTWSLVLDFSERMSPSSTWAFTLSKWWSTITWAYLYNAWLDKLTFTPSSALTAWTYIFSANSNAKDWSNNNSIIQPVNLPSLIVPDITAPIWSSLWSWTWVLINNWSLFTNNNYVQLKILASDDVWVYDMMISNSSLFTWNSWENYSTTKNNWQLTSWTWTKTVYIKFKDGAWNISSTYSSSITYDNTPNYISFNNSSSVYTNNPTISLSWWCNYISSTGTTLDSLINYSVNWTPVWNLTCSVDRTWSRTFNINAWASNTIELSYNLDSSIRNSIEVINPIPTCSPVSNWVVTWTYPSCSLTCNSWFTKIWWSCVANACAASTQTINWHSYTVPAMANGLTSSGITSAQVAISNGTITYTQAFSCSAWTISTNWSESAIVPACNSWYTPSWLTCVVSSSWGGWWGWGWGGWWWGWAIPDFCPSWDKSWSIYDNKCDAPATSTGKTNTWWTIPGTNISSSWVTDNIDYQPISNVTELKIDNINATFFKNLSESVTYIKSITKNQRTTKLTDAFKAKLTFDWIEYFITYDKDFTKEYNKIVNIYTLFITSMDKYYSWDTSTTNKTNIANLYKQLLVWFKTVEDESQKEKIWFMDIESSFALKDILYLALKWVIKWYEGNLFKPNNPVTRAEYLWIIMKTLNVEVDSSKNTTVYSDIPTWWEWMIKYVEKAREFGINWQTVNGKKYFKPNDNISRAEAMAMLFSVAKIKVDDIEISEFSDIPSDALWMVKYVEKARELWIVSWQTVNGKLIFRPNDPISRWETARVITKTLDTLNN